MSGQKISISRIGGLTIATNLPLTNAPIGETGLNFTPERFPLVWDTILVPLLNSLGTGSALPAFDRALWGCGRVVGEDYFTSNSEAIAVPVPAALALTVPTALYFAADEGGLMHRIAVEEAFFIGDVPAALDAQFGFLRAIEIPDSDRQWTLEAFGWSAVPDPQNVAQGYPCLGQVFSDADAVTLVDSAAATVIFPQPFVQKLLRSLVGGVGGGGTGALSGETIPMELLQPPSIKDYVDAKNEEQDTEIEKLKSAADLFPAPFDLLADEIALNRGGVAEVNPPTVERGQISVLGPNFGLAQNDTPDYSPTTGDESELFYDEQSGLFGAPQE